MLISKITAILSVIIVFTSSTNSLKILGVLHTSIKSHYYPFNHLMQGLLNHSHEVTTITFHKTLSPHENLTEVILSKSDSLHHSSESEMFTVDMFNSFNRFHGLSLINKLATHFCVNDLNSSTMRRFLNINQTFDLLIIESFCTDCYLGLVDKYKVPFVLFSSAGIYPMLYERFGQPDNPAYIPSLISGNPSKMSFFERLENTLVHYYHIVQYKWLFMDEHYKAAKKVFGDELRPFDEIAMEASLLLINTHFTLAGGRPSVPSVIEVGGMHIGEQKILSKVSNVS